MAEHGGFEHNRHGLRIVEVLEYRYADFPGLNLSLEVLEAMAHHSKRADAPEVRAFASSSPVIGLAPSPGGGARARRPRENTQSSCMPR